jgi:hypothetical protein
MSKLNRIAMALLLAQPLVVGAGVAAFAFSMVDRDSAPGPGIADSDAQIDNLSDQFARGWITTPVDYEGLLRQDWVPVGSTDATPVTLAPTVPVKEQ